MVDQSSIGPRRSHGCMDRGPGFLRASYFAAALCALGSFLAEPVPAQVAETPEAIEAPQAGDGPVYLIGAFHPGYLRDNPLSPSLEEAMATPITLGVSDTGYIAPRDGVPAVSMSLAELSEGEAKDYHASAVQTILLGMYGHFSAQDILGVSAYADPRQITGYGEDLRPGGQEDLTIIILVGIVTEMRTMAAGERVGEDSEIKPDDRIDNPRHARILERSPLKPYEEGDTERKDLLLKSELDRYLFHLGRHQGRRVDVALAPALEEGGASLDYMVTENRPLTVYGQVANTGTRSTGYWRERVGFFHTQFTENDDILSLDYTTAEFDKVHAVVGSYEAPFSNDRIRWRLQGTWSEYGASDIGAFDERFTGESWSIDGQIIANIHQNRELFIDLVAGVRYEEQKTENELFGIVGDEDFIVPYVGFRLDRATEWFNTQGNLMLDLQDGDLNNLNQDDLARLGRTQPDVNWAILRWNVTHSVYLEPLLNREAWEDPSTPESPTLAHEILASFRGQHSFGSRLIPQAEGVIGGLYSVRGYPQSAVAADTTLIGSLEYRYHVPRAFAINPEPGQMFGQPFRYAPQYVYGYPDWDLILKGFFDIGHGIISDPLSFESDETLIGAGIGIELLWKRNLNIRIDWGFALDDLEGSGVHSGSNRLHFVATILF